MTHKEVLNEFTRLFPNHARYLTRWQPLARNAIRMTLGNPGGQEFIFEYNKPTDWRLETLSRFVKG